MFNSLIPKIIVYTYSKLAWAFLISPDPAAEPKFLLKSTRAGVGVQAITAKYCCVIRVNVPVSPGLAIHSNRVCMH